MNNKLAMIETLKQGTAVCIDLANSKQKVLCTWWVSN